MIPERSCRSIDFPWELIPNSTREDDGADEEEDKEEEDKETAAEASELTFLSPSCSCLLEKSFNASVFLALNVADSSSYQSWSFPVHHSLVSMKLT